MTTPPGTDWRKEFGISDWEPPVFFGRKEDIDAAAEPPPQAHALRRAFESMKLDGIVCFDKAPVIYFKEVQQIQPAQVRKLHRQFWNQGLAPILVLIDPLNVHVYSGLATPLNEQSEEPEPDCLVQTLNRVAEAAEIRQLVLAVESGEFFRTHARSFDPKRRVDRELLRNLRATRDKLEEATTRRLDPQVLDSLLCRLVFACYLFDRGIIGGTYLESLGIPNAAHLRDILGRQLRSEARQQLYQLFKKLGEDFNGDLFSDNLDEEAAQVTAKHVEILDRFFHAANVETGQMSFWPYDFSVIPIETISAIYEHFLKAGDPEAKKKAGAFYTPRFLVEIILDIALKGRGDLLDKRFLDPACGSGIFLVGLFNRLAEEWKRKQPGARYDRRADGLLGILSRNLFGVDQSRTACHIAAFSLCLAFLDQLSPPDIQELQRKGKFLPKLVARPDDQPRQETPTILCADFFGTTPAVPDAFDLVVGNPPWKSEPRNSQLVRWCTDRKLPIPDRQAAVGFVWKAPHHAASDGTLCFVLPHGVLFNHGTTALAFQREWLTRHRVESVLNLADYQRFLFEEAENPALVVRYRKEPPTNKRSKIHYLTPKTDWRVTQAELVSVYPQDQTWIELREVLGDLRAGTVPLVWKERFSGTPRDWKLLDRLRLFPKLADIVGHSGDDHQPRWIIGQGFQQPGPSDPPEDRKTLNLPTRNLIEARACAAKLIVLQSDCDELPSAAVTVRTRSNTNTEVFRGPHVLITDGFKVAYADFDAAFRQSVRGIHGPKADKKLLVFLAAYLNSPLALYYLFHTSANLGVERAKAEAGDVLRLPFPLPDDTPKPAHAATLVDRVNVLFGQAVAQTDQVLSNRPSIVLNCVQAMTEAIFEYFDIDSTDRVLIEDTNNILLRSARRRRASEQVPTLQASTPAGRGQYIRLLCDTLDGWANTGPFKVTGQIHTSGGSGLGIVVLDKVRKGEAPPAANPADGLFSVLERLQRLYRKELGSVEIVPGLKVFDRNTLYLIKPLSQRFWTRTAALNDADEIAAAVIMRPAREKV